MGAQRKYTLITGASSGIGRALAYACAAEGQALILTARRGDRLKEIGQAHPDLPLEIVEADLGSAEGRRQLIDHCERQGWEINTLINNAGLGYQRNFEANPDDKINAMIEVNMQALVELTRTFLPAMIKRGEGNILNVGSIAGFQPIPGFALYAATKSFVLSFSEALYEENRRRGVFVGVLCPGPVETEFHQVAGMNLRFFKGSASAERVAALALRQIRHRQPIQFTAFHEACSATAVSFLPRCWVRRLAGWITRSRIK